MTSAQTTAARALGPGPSRSTSDPYAEILSQLPTGERELLRRALASRGRALHDRAGELVGTIAAVLIDRETGWPQWLAVERPSREPGLVGVPVAGLDTFGSHYQVPRCAAQIHGAPAVALAGLSAPLELALCRHYGVPLTRGAELPGERRVTSSRAFQDPGWAHQVGWLPGPRRR